MLDKKRGTVLVENIIFIVLNLVFLVILFLFLFSKMGGAAVLEERYSKQIALIIDSAKPGMEINLSMKDAVKEAKDEDYKGNIVFIQDNIVTVQLREKGGYSYSFFNNVDFDYLYCLTLEDRDKNEKECILKVIEKKGVKENEIK